MSKRIIDVVDYDPCWPEKFNSEAKRIEQAVKPLAITFHHIGSTSVPGLAAKPTIDILAEVSDLHCFELQTHKLVSLGYEAKGEFGIPGRRYFESGGVLHTYHLHVFALGDCHIQRHICFRDYLIAHPKIAADYGKLKKQIANDCHNDIEVYSTLKSDFIAYHQAMAISRWSDL